jgi:hypothetical protein
MVEVLKEFNVITISDEIYERYIYIYIYIYTYMYVWTYICMCIYMSIHMNLWLKFQKSLMLLRSVMRCMNGMFFFICIYTYNSTYS